MFSTVQILEMAPDAAAAEAGKKLAQPRHWQVLGQNDIAVWGECKGSALYQVRAAKLDMGYKCSCPSRKFPCKHVLSLLLLAAESSTAFSTERQPEWVDSWLANREKKANNAAAKKADAAESPSPEQQAAKTKAATQSKQRRHGRIGDGVAQLQTWLDDLIRHGLAEVEKKPFSFWESQAARMIDAQAPGLAGKLRRCSTIPRSGPDWPKRLLVELGKLALLCEAFERIDDLEPNLQDDVRQLVGITLRHEEVIARGTIVSDFWQLIGQEIDDSDRIRSQKTWIIGERSKAAGVVLQFAAGNASFPEPMPQGMRFAADIVLWPGAVSQRAKILDRKTAPEAIGTPPPAHPSFDALLAHAANSLSRNPWLDQWPAAVSNVRLARTADKRWCVVDAFGAALPLENRAPWPLLAGTAGKPSTITGIWNGTAFNCFGFYADGKYQLVRGTP